MRGVLLAALAVGLLIQPPPAHADGPQPLRFSPGQMTRQEPVEQQSPNYFTNNPCCPQNWDPSLWVSNPTLCAWDVDDTLLEDGGSGWTLDPAASVTTALCLISDGYDNFGGDNHVVLAQVQADTPGLSVTVGSDQGGQWVLSPVPIASRGSQQYAYTFCHIDTTGSPNPPNWYPVVADSNGGTGLPVIYSLAVTNPGSHTARGTWASFSLPGTSQTTCP
jgi:hypothetical protein